MPKHTLSQETELTTRNAFTKVEATVSITVNGRELPTLGVLGEALEEAVTIIQHKVTESYKVVPARVN